MRLVVAVGTLIWNAAVHSGRLRLLLAGAAKLRSVAGVKNLATFLEWAKKGGTALRDLIALLATVELSVKMVLELIPDELKEEFRKWAIDEGHIPMAPSHAPTATTPRSLSLSNLPAFMDKLTLSDRNHSHHIVETLAGRAGNVDRIANYVDALLNTTARDFELCEPFTEELY